jgi:alpha-tubulin suppressor-like RCC1 family protein
MREIEFSNFNLKKLSISDKKNQEIYEIVCGRQHTVLVIAQRELLTNKPMGKKIYAFGLDAGVGIDEQESTHVPSLIKIPKLGEFNEDLKFVFSRYNTNVAVDIRGRIFMWGENSNNMKLRKPKLFYAFP